MSTALELSNLPDADVVALAQAGREAAFRELIRRYERPVFSLIYRMIRDRELAEDLAQDTFIKVLNHIDRYRPEFKLSSWLFKIANNVAIDHLRRRQLDTISMDGSPHASTTDAIESTSFEVAVPQESALDELEAKELGSAIEQAISRLRPEYRSCILLRHVEGRSYEEIRARMYDNSLGTPWWSACKTELDIRNSERLATSLVENSRVSARMSNSAEHMEKLTERLRSALADGSLAAQDIGGQAF